MKKISDLTFPQKILEGICLAVIEWRGALTRSMAGWLSPASLTATGVFGTAFMVSGIGFALRRKK